MEIRIGIQNVARELSFETDMTKDDVTDKVRAALKDNTDIELTDTKGGSIIVPAGVLAYIEIADVTARRVGFIAG